MKENREDGGPTLPTTCQGSKQEKGEDAPPQVPWIPPGWSSVYRSLFEEGDAVPEGK